MVDRGHGGTLMRQRRLSLSRRVANQRIKSVMIVLELDPTWHTAPAAVFCAILDQLSEMGFQESQRQGNKNDGEVAWRLDRPDLASTRAEWGDVIPPMLENDLPLAVRRAVDREYSGPTAEFDEHQLSLAMSWAKAPYRDEPPGWTDFIKHMLWLDAGGFPRQRTPGRRT